MLGWRGRVRYYSDVTARASPSNAAPSKRVREEIGLRNVIVMIPFCRTPDEADRVLEEMAANGLERGKNGLEVYVMCEIPRTSCSRSNSRSGSTASRSAATT